MYRLSFMHKISKLDIKRLIHIENDLFIVKQGIHREDPGDDSQRNQEYA